MVKTCSRPGCPDRAVAQLSYAYSESEVEVRPVGVNPPVGAYVLCRVHVDRLRVPKGWRLIVSDDFVPQREATSTPDRFEVLAAKIRRAGGLGEDGELAGTEHSLSNRANLVTLASRAHMRVVADASRYGQRT